MTHYRVLWGALALGSIVGTGCIVNEQRCDAHQVEIGGDFALCVCEPNAVFNESGAGCTPCGENETVQMDRCACAPGFARETPDAACTPSSIGSACNAATPCPAAFPYCVMPAGASDGYCSKEGCTTNADCTAGYTCESGSAGSRYCRRPPTGLGSPCTSNTDCASFEANSCETLSAKQCILQGCAQGAVSCPNEWACCDYSSLLGSPLSICSPPSMLSGGMCSMGGTRVDP